MTAYGQTPYERVGIWRRTGQFFSYSCFFCRRELAFGWYSLETAGLVKKINKISIKNCQNWRLQLQEKVVY